MSLVLRWAVAGAGALRELPRRVLLFLIAFYRAAISPLTPPACRFEPTCSVYAEEAIRRHGALRGGLLGLYRILRCNPFSRGGFEPVPPAKGALEKGLRRDP